MPMCPFAVSLSPRPVTFPFDTQTARRRETTGFVRDAEPRCDGARMFGLCPPKVSSSYYLPSSFCLPLSFSCQHRLSGAEKKNLFWNCFFKRNLLIKIWEILIFEIWKKKMNFCFSWISIWIFFFEITVSQFSFVLIKLFYLYNLSCN